MSTATEELKQRLVAVSSRLERYEARCKQYRQNHMFRFNQKRFYDMISNNARKTQPIPDNTESNEFGSALWDKPIKHNTDTSWLKDMRKEQATQQDNFQVQLGTMRQHLKGMPNWKAPGPDQVLAFWIKNLKSLHERLAHHLQVWWSQDNFHSEWVREELYCLSKMKKRARWSATSDQ